MKDVLKQFCPVKVRARLRQSILLCEDAPHPRQCKTQASIRYSSYEDKVRHNESQTPLQAVNCDVSKFKFLACNRIPNN